MTLEQRISAFISFGHYIQNVKNDEANADFVKALSRAEAKNPWFSQSTIRAALDEIAQILEEKTFRSWISRFYFQEKNARRIALVTEGKTPFDSFQDILCILLTGNILIVKPSDKDFILVSFLLSQLIAIEPEFAPFISIQDCVLPKFDAIITPFTNKSVELYLQKVPHIIRKEKTSVAILTGKETVADLKQLGNDIFYNFGLSPRNVSKIYMPETFDETKILDALEEYNSVSMHYKYMNNYEYNKSIYLVAQQKHFDNGFLILKEDKALKSPLAVVFYEKYSNINEVQKSLEQYRDEILYVVGTQAQVPFGATRIPRIEEYNSTLNFLINL